MGDYIFLRSQHPRARDLQRDAKGLEGQPLTRDHCHGGVLAAFPRELLKNGSRAISVGTEDVNRERAELETAFPRCVIIHPEQLVYVRRSVALANGKRQTPYQNLVIRKNFAFCHLLRKGWGRSRSQVHQKACDAGGSQDGLRPYVSAQEVAAETEHHGSGLQRVPCRNVHDVW
jgi:hypothetical protein